MTHVIFICTGNICRSAMAQGYLKYRLKELGIDDKILVTSAGTYAIDGQVAPNNAKTAIGEYGINIDEHKAVSLKRSNIEQADYILVMTNKHKKDIIKKYSHLESKIHLLKEYVDNKTYIDIDDPWGYSLGIYKKCAEELVNCIEQFIKKELL